MQKEERGLFAPWWDAKAKAADCRPDNFPCREITRSDLDSEPFVDCIVLIRS